jgi:hypothetical protein
MTASFGCGEWLASICSAVTEWPVSRKQTNPEFWISQKHALIWVEPLMPVGKFYLIVHR